MLETLIKTYADRSYSHPVMVRHMGTLLAFAMDEGRRIRYSVLDTAMAGAGKDADGWLATPRELAFPSELADVGYAVTDQVQLPVVWSHPNSRSAVDADPFLSSTARFTADAPFQVLSDGGDVVVF